MSTKDLFKKGNKVLTKSQVDKIKKDLESEELVRDVVKASNRFLSHVDYSKPENFTFYGSAEKYYQDSFDRIYKTYPYDGSQKEKQQWFNDSSELDLWIYDNAHPKTTGYVKLGTNQSVIFKGGPNKDPNTITGQLEELSKQYPTKKGKSNIWNPTIYRNSNLYIDGSLGNTIEFWAKIDGSVSGDITLFRSLNGSGTTIQVTYNTSGTLTLTYTDDATTGLSGADGQFSLASFVGTNWAHYAFSFINSGSNVTSEVYKNGALVSSKTVGTNLGTVSQENLSAIINGTATNTGTVNGLFIDDFRFWKRRRTGEEIGRFWHTSVFGGTNTDDEKYNTENRKVDLGVYYKFNEGITGTTSIDEVVLDYSGRISNGTITSYSTTVRSTNSAFDEYLDSSSEPLKSKEEKEPIIYSTHPDVVSALNKYRSLGLVHDLSNNSSIYHTMPGWITDEDGLRGENIKELSQVISSYFDNAQIQVQELTNLQEKRYNSLKTENDKPFFLIRKNLESQGFEVPDLFTEASAFEEILSRSETFKFEEKIQDIKNTIYQNIYNNLSYIYKSKGTEKSFRNLIRCFGIDDELLKINLYSDGVDYSLEDTRRVTAIKKKFVDFNNTDRKTGLVYTKADSSNSESTSFIRGVGYVRKPNLSFTFQTEIIFPKRISKHHPQYSLPTNLEEHIALLGEYTAGYTNNKLFTLKAIKENSDPTSENVKFSLLFDGQTIETEFFKSVYENSKWNIAVRMVPKKEISTLVSGAAATDYEVQLYCVRTISDTIEEEVVKTATITEANARAILAKDKYVSIGALHGTGNPTSSTTSNDTFIKMSSTLFWYDNITNEEIKAHATDGSNFGRLYPNDDAYATDTAFNTGTASAIQVPRRDTLVLHWDFSKVTTTDSSGEFIVDDLSEGFTKTLADVNEKSILFDGTDDHVVVPDSDDFSFVDGSGDKAFSISAWAYVGDISSDNGPFVTKSNNTLPTRNEYIFKHANGVLQVFLYDSNLNAQGNALRAIANSATISSATWVHVTVTYDGSTNASGLKLYTNGSQTASTNSETGTYVKMRSTATPLTFGATEDLLNANRIYEDKLADICIFNKQLTDEEVAEIYNNNQVKDMTKVSTYNNLISWWKMGDDLDTTGAGGIKDYKGTHHGTLTNGAAITTEASLSSDKYLVSGKYGWFTDLVGFQVTGEGKHFQANDKQVINTEFVYSAKHRAPEVINSEELVQIRSQDDISFPKDADVTTHFFAAEKSMYQVISDDMINLFATITEFNDLIGQPVNRYRMEYKALEKFRQRYYEKVKNVPSFEKYLELYKWIDSSIGMMIQQLIPISSNFSADLRNMVESHILERNKYWTKFPTMEMSEEPIIGIAKGINELTYNWKDGTPTFASAFINFTSSTASDYDGKFITLTDANSNTINFVFDDDNAYTTGQVIIGSNISVQVNGMSSTTAIAAEFVSAITATTSLAISATSVGNSVTLVQDNEGDQGNTTVTVNFSGQTPAYGSENFSSFSGGRDTFLWGDQRVSATDITTGSATVDANREILRKVVTRTTEGLTHLVDRDSDGNFEEENKPVLRKDDGSVYEGRAYINRALSKPYKINIQKALTLRGGVNYSETTKDPNSLIRASTRIIPGAATSGVQLDGLGTNPVTYEEWKKKYTVKRTSSVTIKDTEVNIDLALDGDVIYPYYGTDFRDASATLVNIHSDSYGDDAEIPVQSPFTETWVGGNQHRHVDYLTGYSSTGSANFVRGDTNEIVIPHNDDFSFTDGSGQDYSAAISFWIKPNHSSTQYIMAKYLQASGDREWYIYLFSNSIFFILVDDGGSPEFACNTTGSPVDQDSNEWYHIVINFKASTVANSSDIEFWINGNLNNTVTENHAGYNGMSITTAPIMLGNLKEGFSQGFEGEMKDVAIFNFKDQSTALSSADVAALYSGNISNHPRKDKLVGWWTLYKDATGYLGRNGTADSGITFNAPTLDAGKRPELYINDSGTLKHPHETNTNIAAARLTRDEVAKRPLNIRNIKTDTTTEYYSPLGNYTKDYEIVQTSGRTQNNSWFVASGSGTPTTIQHPFVVGNEDTANIVGRRKRSADFALPDRGTSDHVIVERFSSPGESLTMTRGYLDRIAEEFSPYAGMNNRNLDIRSDYAKRLYTHSGFHEGSQGYESSSPVLPSVHKVNRNGKFVLVGYSTDGTAATETYSGCIYRYDNAYVTHQIPRSDLQYHFVTSSINAGFYKPEVVTRCGSSTPLRYSGYYEDIYIQKGNEGYNASYADYQASGWRFIRNVEKPAIVNQRKTNTYSQLSRTDNSSRISQTSSYVEPAVSWNKPNTHYILDEEFDQKARIAAAAIDDGAFNSDLRLATLPLALERAARPISYSYANNLEFFANPELTDAIDARAVREGQFYDSLIDLLADGELLFTRSIARELIYPRHRNIGLKKIRSRSKFDTYKFFWKDKMFDRIKGDNTTKLGYTMSSEFQKLFSQKYSVDAMDSFIYRQTMKSAVFNGTTSNIAIADTDVLTPTTEGFSISLWFMPTAIVGLDMLAEKEDEYAISFSGSSVRAAIYDNTGSNDIFVAFTATVQTDRWYSLVVTYDGGLNQDSIKAYLDGENLFTTSTDSISTFTANTSSVLNIGSYRDISNRFEGKMYDFAIYNKELSPTEAREIYLDKSLDNTTSVTPVLRLPLSQDFLDAIGTSHGTASNVTFSSDVEHYSVIGDLTYLGEDRTRHFVTRKDVSPLNTASTTYFRGLEGIRDAVIIPSIAPLYADDVAIAPIPSPQLYHNPYNDGNKESLGWINRKSLSGNSAAYNDYDSFSEEVKLAAQNYGLVSEFRISEHMDKYILENGGNFQTKNYDFLTLDGASHDGDFHTLSSGTSTKETTSFYSAKKEDATSQITSYPTSTSDDTLIINNANGFEEYNKIFAPSANSTFTISNSVNSSFEIGKSVNLANFTSNEPPQSGINAAAKFNIDGTNDFLIAKCNVVEETGANDLGIQLSQATDETMPFAVSIWAQPEASSATSHGLWSAGPDGLASININLFSKYAYSAGESGYTSLGLTFARADGGSGSPNNLPGGTINDASTAYTFFKKDGTMATLTEGRMNHVFFQMIPPEKTQAVGQNLNIFIKLWLNGEELYGVHIRELDDTIYTSRQTNYQSINAYSPCPIGDWHIGGDNPWLTNYDTDFDETLIGTTPIENFVIGNCDFSDSMNNNTLYGGATPQNPFVGLLDEFCVFRGILPSESVKAIYNNGVPNNVNELIINNKIKGNILSKTSISDNGEFDFNNYDSVSTQLFSEDFQTYTPDQFPTLNTGLKPSGYSNIQYQTISDSSDDKGALVKSESGGNKIMALAGAADQPGVSNPPTPSNSATLFWRWLSLGTFNYNANLSPIRMVSFKVYEGIGQSTVTDPYGLESPETDEDLWFQYSIDGGTNWITLRQFIDSENLTLSTTHYMILPNTGTNNLDFRWISGTKTDPDTDSFDHWGIDDVKVYRDSDLDSVQNIPVPITSGAAPLPSSFDFDNATTGNWTISTQASIEPILILWHRIGVPNYTKVTDNNNWSDEFFNSYVHTDNLQFIEKADESHDSLALQTSEKVRLKVSAIKKLLPYEGFYPQDRTVQIADLFVQKIKNDISHDSKVYKEQAIQAALQHFFAPGILYNSIKSGVACDWATYTNASGMEPAYFGYPIKHFASNDIVTEKYSPRLFPQWYSKKTYNSSTDVLLSSAPTNVEAVSPITASEHFATEVGLTAENVTKNSFTDFSNYNLDYLVKNLVITKEPNKRLPFESILDPYKYLFDGRNNSRVSAQGADSEGFPKLKLKHNQHFLMDPSYYKDILKYNHTAASSTFTVTVDEANSNYKKFNYPYFEISSGIENKDSRYEMAINNFVAEATKFFIRDEKLSSFASTTPQGDGFMMESGSSYFMDVVMEKSVGFSVANSQGSLGGRYFGPPVMWMNPDLNNFGTEEQKVSDAAFAPYVPPYFYESSVARISFTASTTKKHSLDEIFESASVENISTAAEDFFSNEAIQRINRAFTGGPLTPTNGDYKNSPSYKARMPVSSSIELFGKTKLNRQEFDAEGRPMSISSANNEELDTWVIYSKFECPLFDFSETFNNSSSTELKKLGINLDPSESLKRTNFDYDSFYLDPQNTERFTTDKRTGSGIWAGLGKQVDGSGVTISIRESFPDGVSATTGSLIEVCGFTPQTKQVGRVADEKQISEAVVMIPFLDEPLITEQQLFGGGTRNVYATINVDDRNFIKIDNLEYRRQKRNFDRQNPAYDVGGREVDSSSITKMIEGMRKYNIPPLYDFETFEQDPFVMYFFEFNHTLDREDLSNIWQGIQPKVAKEASLDSVEVFHDINEHEFFGNLGDIPKGVRWMVFKVKQKAEKSYYNLTEDSRDDKRFKFNFNVGTKEPEYGYNYPYDYFTMLEMIQVEASSDKKVNPLEKVRELFEDDK